jgi:hypothetical protein
LSFPQIFRRFFLTSFIFNFSKNSSGVAVHIVCGISAAVGFPANIVISVQFIAGLPSAAQVCDVPIVMLLASLLLLAFLLLLGSQVLLASLLLYIYLSLLLLPFVLLLADPVIFFCYRPVHI